MLRDVLRADSWVQNETVGCTHRWQPCRGWQCRKLPNNGRDSPLGALHL